MAISMAVGGCMMFSRVGVEDLGSNVSEYSVWLCYRM